MLALQSLDMQAPRALEQLGLRSGREQHQHQRSINGY